MYTYILITELKGVGTIHLKFQAFDEIEAKEIKRILTKNNSNVEWCTLHTIEYKIIK